MDEGFLSNNTRKILKELFSPNFLLTNPFWLCCKITPENNFMHRFFFSFSIELISISLPLLKSTFASKISKYLWYRIFIEGNRSVTTSAEKGEIFGICERTRIVLNTFSWFGTLVLRFLCRFLQKFLLVLFWLRDSNSFFF